MTGGISTTTQLDKLISELRKLTNSDNPQNIPGLLTSCSPLLSALSATADVAILDHFLRTLNGLDLLTKWLHLSADLSNNDVSNELALRILSLLDRLPVGPDLPGYEGILTSVKQLALHESTEIKDRAVLLCNKWSNEEEGPGQTESTDPPENESGGVELEEKKSKSNPPNESHSSEADMDKATQNNEDDDVDALEVARMVAVQVEAEVMHYRENLDEGKTGKNEEKKGKSEEKAEENEHGQVIAKEKPEEDSGITTGKSDSREGCGLDLNMEFCTENEADAKPIQVSALKSAPSLNVSSPPQFEGSGMGWDGTAAATSAFRLPDCEKTVSGAKRKSDSFDLNLNAAEPEDQDHTSSPEVSSSIRSKKPKLDLNIYFEEAEAEGEKALILPDTNRANHSLSSASSSSFRVRDFDLNDEPSFLNPNLNPNPNASSCSEITIMGSRFAVTGNHSQINAPPYVFDSRSNSQLNAQQFVLESHGGLVQRTVDVNATSQASSSDCGARGNFSYWL